MVAMLGGDAPDERSGDRPDDANCEHDVDDDCGGHFLSLFFRDLLTREMVARGR
jgi:hypothetical protein